MSGHSYRGKYSCGHAEWDLPSVPDPTRTWTRKQAGGVRLVGYGVSTSDMLSDMVPARAVPLTDPLSVAFTDIAR